MKNIVKVWSSSVAFLLSAFSFLILITSCSNELDETLLPANNGTLQFVVGDFPTFGEGTQTRVIGTQDEGKTAWANEDKILVHLYSQKYGDQAVTLTFDAENNTWESDGGTLSYLENETPTITAVYALIAESRTIPSYFLKVRSTERQSISLPTPPLKEINLKSVLKVDALTAACV